MSLEHDDPLGPSQKKMVDLVDVVAEPQRNSAPIIKDGKGYETRFANAKT